VLTSELLAVGSGLAWAASAIVVKKLRSAMQVDLLSLTAWQMLLGAIVLAAIAWMVPEELAVTGVPLILAVAYVAIVGTGLAWFLWLFVLDALPAGVAGMDSLAVPAIGVPSYTTAWACTSGATMAPAGRDGVLRAASHAARPSPASS